jgi:NAD(P)-dependent dehydrogenase (short-subunit alcohol dehydrogenase family)
MNTKRIIVTGGATNIGLAITESFLEGGAQVAIGQPDLSVTVALLKKHPSRLFAFRVDVTSPEQCKTFIEAAAAAMGGVDVLVNNAAITGPGAIRMLANIDQEHFDSILSVNLRGVLFCSQAVVPHLKRSNGGVIINISSINAFRPQKGAMVYAASKAALSSLTQSMAKELSVERIRVVAVAPGDIVTDQTGKSEVSLPTKSAASDIVGLTPLGRGIPEDIGAVVSFLCSNKARFVTGTTWVVDGGLLS